jgi:hypothetical protein
MKARILSTLSALMIIPGTIREPMHVVPMRIELASPRAHSGMLRVSAGGAVVREWTQSKSYPTFFFRLLSTGEINGSRHYHLATGALDVIGHGEQIAGYREFDLLDGAANFVLIIDPR